jgi:hypothetical protein
MHERPTGSGSGLTETDVAAWMLAVLERQGWLYQDDAVSGIEQEFGPQFTYENASGGTGINRKVLREFRKLTENTAVWDRADKSWRVREPHHEPGRLQW